MSYDIYLNEPSSGETIQLPIKHIMTGGTYAADYDEATGMFTPAPTSEAWLNITYNYGHYYSEVMENGIRAIYGKHGCESIPIIKDMISKIEQKYKIKGEWVETVRHRIDFYSVDDDKKILFTDVLRMDCEQYYKKEYDETISEGPNPNYWEATAANAIKPLYQLMVMAELRPDGIWDGD